MGSEALLRLSAFVGGFALLALAEALSPRRLRAFTRRSRWTGNVGLVAVATLLVRLVVPMGVAGIAAVAEASGGGILHGVGPLPLYARILVSIVLLDFAIYLQHVLFHVLPLLWRLHRVHHTDPEVDVTTGVRFHPAEMLLSVAFKAGAVVLIGPPVEAVVLFEIVLNAGSLFSHANLRLPETADRWLRWVLVTPDVHRLHHSFDPGERDHNFGFTLTWWDRLCGTYRAHPRAGHEAMRIGVMGFDAREGIGLGRLLAQPFSKGRPSSRADVPQPAAEAGDGERPLVEPSRRRV